MHRRISHRESFEVLREAIPNRDAIEAVARFVGVDPNEVYRWRREPESGDQPTATGRRSPLDRSVDLIDAIYLHSPEGASIVVNYLVARLDHLRQTHRRADWNPHEAVSDATATISLVIADLGDGQITDSDVKLWRKLKHLVDEGFEQVVAICREGRQ